MRDDESDHTTAAAGFSAEDPAAGDAMTDDASVDAVAHEDVKEAGTGEEAAAADDDAGDPEDGEPGDGGTDPDCPSDAGPAGPADQGRADDADGPDEGEPANGEDEEESADREEPAGDNEDGDGEEEEDEAPLPLLQVVEAVLFAAREPLKPAQIARAVGRRTRQEAVRQAIQELNVHYLETGRAFEVADISGRYQLMSRPEFARHIMKIYPKKELSEKEKSHRLTPTALDTLAIIAYKQPVTRGDIEHIRGVACGSVLKTLIERGSVRVVGKRTDLVGQPRVYGTTEAFLAEFGLGSLDELPLRNDFLGLLGDDPGTVELLPEQEMDGDADDGRAAAGTGEATESGDASGVSGEGGGDALPKAAGETPAGEEAGRAEGHASAGKEESPEDGDNGMAAGGDETEGEVASGVSGENGGDALPKAAGETPAGQDAGREEGHASTGKEESSEDGDDAMAADGDETEGQGASGVSGEGGGDALPKAAGETPVGEEADQSEDNAIAGKGESPEDGDDGMAAGGDGEGGGDVDGTIDAPPPENPPAASNA